jgi:hemolysin III
MKRIKLKDRLLPDYTRGEEIFNMVSHIVGASFGVVALVLTVVFSALKGDAWSVVASAIYGSTMILLYTVSSVYHGLHMNMGKRVMQVVDHCTIFLLIAGTYTPVALCAIRRYSPAWCWVLFGVVWGCAAAAAVFTAIDLKKYARFSMVCYLAMGWCIVIAIKPTLASVPLQALLWILLGGIAYTAGIAFFASKKKYFHSIWHFFVLAGSILHFFCVYFYVL